MASHYNLLEYDSDEEREKIPIVPIPNLMSAALFMAGIFERANIPYAIMGGFAIKLMGGARDTRDVDIAFEAPRKMRDLWSVVEAEPRLVIPNTKLLSNLMKVFVLTGPGYDDCSSALRVEVDLIENGFQGSPRELSLNRDQLSITTTSGEMAVYTISLLYLVRSKLAAFMSRSSTKDKSDIMHLLNKRSDEIQAFSNSLDPEAVTYFLDTMEPEMRTDWAEFFGR